MNEIKFRAWLRYEKEMSEVLVLDNQEKKVFVVRKDGASGCRMFAELELVQYTGLKDKNGVEIYEGDILEMAEQSLLRFEVVYDAGHMAFMRNWIDKRVPATRGKGEMEYLSANTDFLEVIGNRFENPELLKEGNQ